MKRYEFESAVYDPDKGLTVTQVGVLLWYAHHKNWKNDGLAWGSAESIARDTRFGTRSVERARPVLEELGWLVDTGERVPTMNGRPLVKYDLEVGVSRQSGRVSRQSDGGFPPNRTEKTVRLADEQVREQDIEQDREQVPTTGRPVVDSSSNYVVKEELQTGKSLSVGSRDAARAATEILQTSRGWRLGNVIYQSEFDALAAQQRVLEKERKQHEYSS